MHEQEGKLSFNETMNTGGIDMYAAHYSGYSAVHSHSTVTDMHYFVHKLAEMWAD